MSRAIRLGFLAAISPCLLAPPALAGTLRCYAFNGNVSCVGAGSASCQSVNGRTVCLSGGGDVVQSFGAGVPDDALLGVPASGGDDDAIADDGDSGTAHSAAPMPGASSGPHAVRRR
jgi:hypothetical protein